MLEAWSEGWAYLCSDDLVSYYSFFTVIFAEIAFLWGFGVENALIFSILLAGCIVNVLFTAFLKGSWVCENKFCQRVSSIIYVMIYAVLLVVGLTINAKLTYIMFAVPFLWTGLAVWLRGYQNSCFGPGFSKVVYAISNFIQKPIVLISSQIILLGLPLIFLGYFISQIEISLALKFILVVGSVLIAPIWAYVEDSWATKNIFELIYDNDWW